MRFRAQKVSPCAGPLRRGVLLGALALAGAVRPADPPAPTAAAATHQEAGTVAVPFRRLTALCLDRQGRLLAADAEARVIRVIGTDGKAAGELAPGLAPEAIAVAADGSLYCGGDGKLAKLSEAGQVVTIVDLPAGGPADAPQQRRLGDHGTHVSGLAVTGRQVFATIGSGWSVGAKAKLFRFERDLSQPTPIMHSLRGCCQRCDLAALGEDVLVAENAAYRVLRLDANGKVLGQWGRASRTEVEGFGSCCNPMNLCLGSDGSVYTAESGLGRVKRFTADGTFMELVGSVGTARFTQASGFAASCSNIALAVVPGGDRIYVMDYRESCIRILQRSEAGHAP